MRLCSNNKQKAELTASPFLNRKNWKKTGEGRRVFIPWPPSFSFQRICGFCSVVVIVSHFRPGCTNTSGSPPTTFPFYFYFFATVTHLQQLYPTRTGTTQPSPCSQREYAEGSSNVLNVGSYELLNSSLIGVQGIISKNRISVPKQANSAENLLGMWLKGVKAVWVKYWKETNQRYEGFSSDRMRSDGFVSKFGKEIMIDNFSLLCSRILKLGACASCPLYSLSSSSKMLT